MSITSWQKFAKIVRKENSKLLKRLPEFDDPVLITGCQRSGTSIMSKLMLHSEGFADYRRDNKFDSELEGALILSDSIAHKICPKRYCFQTTYLNESFTEFFEHKGSFKMICMIRNPLSVVYSMCYHWGRRRDFRSFALDELFLSCGLDGLTEKERKRFDFLGNFGISKFRKACLCYIGKSSQIFEYKQELGSDILILDYDDVIQNKQSLLPEIYHFLGMPYDKKVEGLVHAMSLRRSSKLTDRQKERIKDTCWGVYEQISALKYSPPRV
jgi:hypothetical protein